MKIMKYESHVFSISMICISIYTAHRKYSYTSLHVVYDYMDSQWPWRDVLGRPWGWPIILKHDMYFISRSIMWLRLVWEIQRVVEWPTCVFFFTVLTKCRDIPGIKSVNSHETMTHFANGINQTLKICEITNITAHKYIGWHGQKMSAFTLS